MARFHRPTKSQRMAAASASPRRKQLATLPTELARAVNINVDPDSFHPLPRVRRGDWLASHAERGQTFESFARRSFRISPHAYFTTCYVVPYGDFLPGRSPCLKRLTQVASAFLGFSVKALKQRPLKVVSRNMRTGCDGQTQVKVQDIFDNLQASKLPRDSFCSIGVTMTDLYPGEDWNFVFGQASLTDGVGAFSFGRYDPQCDYADTAYEGEDDARDTSDETMLLWRSCKVFCHETAHVLGLKHCIYYNCLMNGTNHLEEFDSKPLHLCPVCLRKLQSAVGFDVAKRYKALLDVFTEVDFAPEAAWVARRLEVVCQSDESKSGTMVRAKRRQATTAADPDESKTKETTSKHPHRAGHATTHKAGRARTTTSGVADNEARSRLRLTAAAAATSHRAAASGATNTAGRAARSGYTPAPSAG